MSWVEAICIASWCYGTLWVYLGAEVEKETVAVLRGANQLRQEVGVLFLANKVKMNSSSLQTSSLT